MRHASLAPSHSELTATRSNLCWSLTYSHLQLPEIVNALVVYSLGLAERIEAPITVACVFLEFIQVQ